MVRIVHATAWGLLIGLGTLAIVFISTPAQDGWQRVHFVVESKCTPAGLPVSWH